MKASHPSMTPGHRGKKRDTIKYNICSALSFFPPSSFPLSVCLSFLITTHTPFCRRLLYYPDLCSSLCCSPDLRWANSSIGANGRTYKPSSCSYVAFFFPSDVADDRTALNNNIRRLQWNMTCMIGWKCFSACYFILRCTAFSMFSLHQSQSATTSMGCADVPRSRFCATLPKRKKFPLLFPPPTLLSPPLLSLSLSSVSRSLSRLH